MKNLIIPLLKEFFSNIRLDMARSETQGQIFGLKVDPSNYLIYLSISETCEHLSQGSFKNAKFSRFFRSGMGRSRTLGQVLI
jgi:hypothetical protein